MTIPVEMHLPKDGNVQHVVRQIQDLWRKLATRVNDEITSGVYTPTITNVTNVAASTAVQCQYMRIGNVVHVGGTALITPTAAAATTFRMTLPVWSTISAASDLSGLAVGSFGRVLGVVSGDVANNRASVIWTAGSTTQNTVSFEYTYYID